MPDPMHFDAIAAVYDRARPPYPQALWDALAERGLLRSGVRVIELGAGSGLATRRMLDLGAEVTAVEPGPALAALLKVRCPEAHVVVARAEDARPAAGAFDVAVAATSVHWLDLDVVLPALHRGLAPDGHLAVWRTVFGDPLVSTPFRDRVEAIVARRGDQPERPGPREHDTDGWVRRLSMTGHFQAVEVREFRWSIDLDADRIRDLFSTFSDWRAPGVDAAAAAVRDLGGVVTEHYVTPLIVLRRRDPPT